jgi:hypothetical protein
VWPPSSQVVWTSEDGTHRVPKRRQLTHLARRIITEKLRNSTHRTVKAPNQDCVSVLTKVSHVVMGLWTLSIVRRVKY